MSDNKNIEEFINVFIISFITTTIVIVGGDAIQLLNDKIEKLNDAIKQLKDVIKENDDKHTFHLKEIEASYNTKLDDFIVKYNLDMLSVNANIERQTDKNTLVEDNHDDRDNEYNAYSILTVMA